MDADIHSNSWEKSISTKYEKFLHFIQTPISAPQWIQTVVLLETWLLHWGQCI